MLNGMCGLEFRKLAFEFVEANNSTKSFQQQQQQQQKWLVLTLRTHHEI
jgi:hypothetical protein